MSEKITVSFRASVARFSRYLAKEGKKLVKFRASLESTWEYGIVDLKSEHLVSKGTHEDLVKWIEESGVLKPYEASKGKAKQVTDQQLIERAYIRYHQNHPWDQNIRDKSIATDSTGKKYVVFRNATDILAVYRLRSDGALKELKRWPKEIQ